MPPVAGAILGFYLSWRISEVCLGPWHFTAPLFITHYSSNCFWFVCLRVCPSVSACVCYILWQLPICALSMEHFPHNWVFPSGPQARLERHDTARQKCVVCGVEFAGFTWRAACSHLDCQPTKHWLDAVLCCGPGCPLDAKQSKLSLMLHLSLALLLYRTLSLCFDSCLGGRAAARNAQDAILTAARDAVWDDTRREIVGV